MRTNPPAPILPTHINKILFICTGNICRSVSAAGFLKKMLEDSEPSIIIETAGIAALDGKQASEKTLQILRQHNIEMDSHRSRKLTSEIVDSANALFVMEKAHRTSIAKEYPSAQTKLFMLSNFYPDPKTFPRESDIPDPIGKNDFFYGNVNEMIQLCCMALCKELTNKA